MAKSRRELLAAGAAAALWSRAASADGKKPSAGAGVPTVPEYLRRMSLLLDETKRAQDFVGQNPADLGLAATALELAEVRNTIAARIAAPPQAKQAHMHLLLALENTTAAFDAKVRGDEKKAAQRMAAARAEEQTLGAALEAAKLKLPPVK
jgi:hypothetical protein